MWQRSVRGVLPGFACSRVPGQQCRPLSVAVCGSNGLATVQRTQQRNLCAEHYRRVLLQERAAERYVRCADRYPQSRGEAACSHRCMMNVPDMGLISGAQHLKDTESDLCGAFATDYLKTQGLLVLAAVSIVVVNAGMRSFMRWLATFERHHSLSAESSSMTMKVFLALFMNTGLVTLLVNANLPKMRVDLQGVGLFAVREQYLRELPACVCASTDWVRMCVSLCVRLSAGEILGECRGGCFVVVLAGLSMV